MKRKYEYAITAGPGLLLDCGFFLVGDDDFQMISEIGGTLEEDFLENLGPNCTVILSPVEPPRKERK